MTIIGTGNWQGVTMIAMPTNRSLLAPADIVWRLTDEALVMPAVASTRLLGRWDCRFGGWEWADNRLNILAVDEPILDRRGIWLDPPGERTETWYACRAALAAWCSLIPTPIRRLVAPHGARQWQLLLAIRLDPWVVQDLDAM